MNIIKRYACSVIIISFFFASCKKDTLHFSKSEKITSNTTDRLNAITVNNNIIYIAGGDRFYSSTILISRDGGNTWDTKNFPEAGKSMYGITTNAIGNVYAVGYEGKILWSSDNGYNWNFKQTSIWEAFKDIDFSDPNNATAIIGISFNSGGRVRIDSIGNTASYDSTATEYNDIEMVTANTGYIAGYGVVLKTKNGGKNWDFLDIKNDNFTAITALNEFELWVCGSNGSIFHTLNGGKDWRRLRNGNDLTKPKYQLHDILFTDNQNGWAVGENGIVIYTDDGGEHWMEYDNFTSSTLRSIAQLQDGKILVCGDNGAVYKLIK